MNFQLAAKEILEHVGGKDNLVNMTHCATRLRLTLKDSSKANNESIKFHLLI